MLRTLAPLFFSFVVAACGGSSPQPTTTPSSGEPGATEPAPAAARKVRLMHGPMTYVMDSVQGQLDKAGEAILASPLVAELRSMGLEVDVSGSEEADGDEVAVVDADGVEIIVTTLERVDSDEAPADVVEAVRSKFGL